MPNISPDYVSLFFRARGIKISTWQLYSTRFRSYESDSGVYSYSRLKRIFTLFTNFNYQHELGIVTNHIPATFSLAIFFAGVISNELLSFNSKAKIYLSLVFLRAMVHYMKESQCLDFIWDSWP